MCVRDSQTYTYEGKDRDLDQTDSHHHIFSKTDTACTQNKVGMVAYLDGVDGVSTHCWCRYCHHNCMFH